MLEQWLEFETGSGTDAASQLGEAGQVSSALQACFLPSGEGLWPVISNIC